MLIVLAPVTFAVAQNSYMRGEPLVTLAWIAAVVQQSWSTLDAQLVATHSTNYPESLDEGASLVAAPPDG